MKKKPTCFSLSASKTFYAIDVSGVPLQWVRDQGLALDMRDVIAKVAGELRSYNIKILNKCGWSICK